MKLLRKDVATRLHLLHTLKKEGFGKRMLHWGLSSTDLFIQSLIQQIFMQCLPYVKYLAKYWECNKDWDMPQVFEQHPVFWLLRSSYNYTNFVVFFNPSHQPPPPPRKEQGRNPIYTNPHTNSTSLWKIRKFESANFVLFQNRLGYSASTGFLYEFSDHLVSLCNNKKKTLGFWRELHQTCRTVWGVFPS